MMVSKNYNTGRKYEYKTMNYLKSKGYRCIRSAGSHGVFDVTAFNKYVIRLIEVKRNDYPLPNEILGMKSFVCPDNCKKEIWIWKNRKSEPEIVTL